MTEPRVDGSLLWATETSEFDVVFKGETIGAYRVELSPDASANILTLRAIYEDANVRTDATVRLHRETLRPLGSFKEIRAPQGTFQISGTYQKGVIDLKAVTPRGPQEVAIPLVEPVFDNDSLLTVIRAIALAPGERLGVEVANLDTARTYFCWLERAAASGAPGGADAAPGTPPSRRVLLTFETADSHEMTYRDEPPHALLRYDNRNLLFILRQFDRSPA